MAVDKDFYNEASAAKLGWTPDWFLPGHSLFDRKLQNAIRAFGDRHPQQCHSQRAITSAN